MFWIWSHQDAIEMAWHMSAGYVSYIARELATSRIRRLRAMGRVGAGAACVNHLGAVLIFAETSWKVLKHVDTGNMLDTCWIHVGFRPGPHAHWANDSNTLFFCEPPLGQDHPSQMSPYRVEPFSPWSRRSRGSRGSTAPGRSGSRTRRSWRWRVQHASPVIPLKQEISETAARKKNTYHRKFDLGFKIDAKIWQFPNIPKVVKNGQNLSVISLLVRRRWCGACLPQLRNDNSRLETSFYFMILPTARATMVPSKNDMPLIPLMRPKKLLPNLSPGGSTRVNRTPLWPTPQRLRHGCGGCWGGGMFKLNITRTSSPGRRMSQIDASLEWDCPKNWNFEPKYDGGRARWLPNSSKLYNDYAPENILGWITGVQDNNPMLASPVERTPHFQPMDFCPSKVATPFFRPACRKFKARWARWLSLAPAFQLHQLSKWSTALANDGPWNLITIKFVDDMVIQNFQSLKM